MLFFERPNVKRPLFLHSFLYLLGQQVFIDLLLCASYCLALGQRGEQDRCRPHTHGSSVPVHTEF